mgnify:CR=1 FL=1
MSGVLGKVMARGWRTAIQVDPVDPRLDEFCGVGKLDRVIRSKLNDDSASNASLTLARGGRRAMHAALRFRRSVPFRRTVAAMPLVQPERAALGLGGRELAVAGRRRSAEFGSAGSKNVTV